MNRPSLSYSGFGSPSPAIVAPMPTARSLSFGSSFGNTNSSPSWSMPSLPTTAGQAFGGGAGTASTSGTGFTAPNVEAADLSFGDRLKSTFMTENGGFDLGAIGDVAKTIGAFGQLWAGIQANKLAKESLAFEKQAYDTNLGNQIAAYNLSLEDRMRARYAQNGRSTADAEAYIDKHRLEK